MKKQNRNLKKIKIEENVCTVEKLPHIQFINSQGILKKYFFNSKSMSQDEHITFSKKNNLRLAEPITLSELELIYSYGKSQGAFFVSEDMQINNVPHSLLAGRLSATNVWLGGKYINGAFRYLSNLSLINNFLFADMEPNNHYKLNLELKQIHSMFTVGGIFKKIKGSRISKGIYEKRNGDDIEYKLSERIGTYYQHKKWANNDSWTIAKGNNDKELENIKEFIQSNDDIMLQEYYLDTDLIDNIEEDVTVCGNNNCIAGEEEENGIMVWGGTHGNRGDYIPYKLHDVPSSFKGCAFYEK